MKNLSYDKMENLLGTGDGQAGSTNRRELLMLRRVLRAALERELTGRQLDCVRLYYYEGKNEEETGRELGISRSTVCRHLQKAKARLERALSYADLAYRSGGGED